MDLHQQYDVAIIGGGLAGLSAAILLAREGHSVVLFEKETYPFHKVCGEYLSLESHDYLLRLGIDLQAWNLPVINRLILTDPKGNSFTTPLPLGGIGVSRYRLDHALAERAKTSGVHVMEGTKVGHLLFENGRFNIQLRSQTISARTCLAAFGKKSNLDMKWNRSFLRDHDKKLGNFIAVKYHIKTSWPDNLIGLHNFENGYCGISRIEDEKFCLCYMTTAAKLKSCQSDIRQLEARVLGRNPCLKKIFETSHFYDDFPVTISQISFSSKTQVENHALLPGDAGGMITPLCGNGMSIALHTGKIAAELTGQFLCGKISREELEQRYRQQWRKHFSRRLRTGRLLQRFFGRTYASRIFVSAFRYFPFLAKPVVKMTHGKAF